ncbi:MAG: tetratricopeptide repeat protein [Desulfobulbaceae bacterium]|nr:tetratricopeptide repeat protein [Desulfobulbaceae bacterium]
MLINKRTGRILILILCVSFFTACSSPEKDKQVYYNNALNYIKQDNREAAILELRSAIQLDAKYGDARYQLGLLYLKEGDPKKAFDELIRAADLLPDNLDANVKVAFFYLMSGKKAESRKHLELVLAKDANYRDALTLLANLELVDGNFDQALAALEKTGDALNTSDELQNLKGRVHSAQKQWDKAEAAFQKAIVINGDNFLNFKTLLFFYKTIKEEEKAKKLLNEIAAKFPENAEAHLLQAGYFNDAGDREKVGEELQKVVEIDPKNPRYRLQLADYYQQAGKIDKAEEILGKARSDFDKNPDITAALATLFFDHGKFAEAKALLDEMKLQQKGHGGAKLLEARFQLKEGKVRDALTMLQELNKDLPDWPEPFFYLSMAHYSIGEVDFAQQAVAMAIQKNGKNPKYHELLAQIYLAKGAFEDARNQAAASLQLNPKNARSALILSRALIGTKQYDQAVAVLTDLRKAIPGSTEILGNLALASLGAKDHKKGIEYLNELLKIDPGHTQAIALLIGLNHKDDLKGAEAFVQQQISKAPKDSRLYLLLGALLEKQKKDNEALAAYDKAQELSPENIESMLVAARVLTRLGKNKEAMAKYMAMVEKNPKSIPGLMGVAALFEAEGNNAKAMEQYKKILEIKEDYAPAANNLAWLIASEPGGDIGKALILAMTAKKALPDDPHVIDTLGWVHYHRGSYALAISQFELALQNRPDDPMITYHLALAQSGNDQKEAAVKTLDKLLARKVEFADRKKAEELLSKLTQK